MVAGETRPSDDSGYNNQGILPQGPKKVGPLHICQLFGTLHLFRVAKHA